MTVGLDSAPNADALALTFAQRVAPVNNKDESTFGKEFGILGNFGGTWMGAQAGTAEAARVTGARAFRPGF